MKLCHRVDFLSKLASRCLSPASRFSGTIEQYRGESSPGGGGGFVSLKKQGSPQLVSPLNLVSFLSYLLYHFRFVQNKD